MTSVALLEVPVLDPDVVLVVNEPIVLVVLDVA